MKLRKTIAAGVVVAATLGLGTPAMAATKTQSAAATMATLKKTINTAFPGGCWEMNLGQDIEGAYDRAQFFTNTYQDDPTTQARDPKGTSCAYFAGKTAKIDVLYFSLFLSHGLAQKSVGEAGDAYQEFLDGDVTIEIPSSTHPAMVTKFDRFAKNHQLPLVLNGS